MLFIQHLLKEIWTVVLLCWLGASLANIKISFFFINRVHLNYEKIELYLIFNSEIPYKGFIVQVRNPSNQLPSNCRRLWNLSMALQRNDFLTNELSHGWKWTGANAGLILKLKAKENHHSYSENRHTICTPLQQVAFSRICKVGRRCEIPTLKYHGSSAGLGWQVGRTAWSPWLLPWDVCSKHFWEVC